MLKPALLLKEMFVKIHLVLVQSSRKEGVTNSSGNCRVICGHFAQNGDLALSACRPPFRSLFSCSRLNRNLIASKLWKSMLC